MSHWSVLLQDICWEETLICSNKSWRKTFLVSSMPSLKPVYPPWRKSQQYLCQVLSSCIRAVLQNHHKHKSLSLWEQTVNKLTARYRHLLPCLCYFCYCGWRITPVYASINLCADMCRHSQFKTESETYLYVFTCESGWKLGPFCFCQWQHECPQGQVMVEAASVEDSLLIFVENHCNNTVVLFLHY